MTLGSDEARRQSPILGNVRKLTLKNVKSEGSDGEVSVADTAVKIEKE